MWRNIIIVSLFVVLPSLAYGAYWWHLATILEETATKNLDEAVQKFADVGLALTYDDMIVIGFPSRPVVKLEAPVFTYKAYGGQMYISADDMIIEPESNDNTTFRILLPKQIHASAKTNAMVGEYDVSADFVPKLTVRTAAGYSEDKDKKRGQFDLAFKKGPPPPESYPKDIIYEYALNMPKNMRMTVAKGDRSVDIGFQWPLVPFRMWQPLRYDITGPYDVFFSFLQEAEEKM
ncbi:MAG: hypothetical protein U1E36_01210 [Rickettsiales bacterium]